jgi:ABC-type uncharacterized transport system ATPase subunit
VGAKGRLEGLAGVRRVVDTGRQAHLELEAGADVQQVMRDILDRVEVHAVKLDEPHIEEIYLQKVGGAAGGEP